MKKIFFLTLFNFLLISCNSNKSINEDLSDLESLQTKTTFVDLDENVFASVGLVSELKRKNLKVIGIMKKVKNRERSKLQSAGCEMIFPKSSVVKNIPKLLDELSF